jgi:hypothetical protein
MDRTAIKIKIGEVITLKKLEGNFFIMENNIFNLHLDVYEFAIYSYLVRCENKEYKC